MSGAKFTDEFKRDAVAQVEDRGYPVREVAERLGVSTKSICTWQKQFLRPSNVVQEVDAQADEIRRLKRDLARVTEEQDILKKATAYFARESPVRYAFIAENRLIFAVRAMCRMLLVHPGGFYAWLREPFSQRALEDQRQTVLLKQAWDDSGEVYGYRKLHDDLCDMGEDISPNRAWRLARLAGIRAQIGYKKRPGSYSGSPAVVADSTLNREFDVDAPTSSGLRTSPIFAPTRGSCIWQS